MPNNIIICFFAGDPNLNVDTQFSPSSRILALNIVGDLLRKVGVSCRLFLFLRISITIGVCLRSYSFTLKWELLRFFKFCLR